MSPGRWLKAPCPSQKVAVLHAPKSVNRGEISATKIVVKNYIAND